VASRTIEERLAALEEEVAALRRIVNGVPLKATTRKRAAQLPADWQPDEADVEKLTASFPNVDMEHETDSFRDYWASKGEARADWSAAYRNWIRKAASFAKAPVTRLQGRPVGRAAAIGESNRARVDGALDKLAAVQQAARARASEG
jgi:hypothetical protein